ncbi:DUF4397 domain-containing protein [Mucilaginibacter terrae]|uniref:DUF4397 domain-containing protein n=1 Tax=Mucilaginibacter terrae TaxID=1955052 RepID=UPI00363AF94A
MKKVTLTIKQTLRYAFVGLLGLTLLSSCKKDDPYNFEDTIGAEVNFINASPDAGSARLYVEDILRTTTGINYGEASGYQKTYLGDQDVDIRSTTGESTLTSSQVQFDANNRYTFLLVGQNSSLGLLYFTDDLTVPGAGKAKVRFVNAAPNATAATLNSATGIVVAQQNFRGIAPSTEVNAGAYVLSVVSGTTRSATATVNLESGKIYTVYAKGLVGGTGNAAFGVGVVAVN